MSTIHRLFRLRSLGFVLSAVVLALCGAGSASAKEGTAPATGAWEEERRLLADRVAELEEKLQEQPQAEASVNREYYRKYYEYLAQKALIHLEIFRWQRRAAEFLLWLVVAVVVSGLLFSGYQLWRAASLTAVSTDSTLEVSAQQIRITSSVVGVVVLSISIVFLYLFLIEVYRIEVVDLGPVETTPSTVEGSARSMSGGETDRRREYFDVGEVGVGYRVP